MQITFFYFSGILSLVQQGKLPVAATSTATFIRNMNDLFDICNSNNLSDVQHKKPITRKNYIEKAKELHQFSEWIDKWVFINREDGQKVTYTVYAF